VTIHKADPDIILGHDFLGVSLDVLLNRMRDLKADHWSRLGRFRRSKWPNIGRQGSNLKFLNGRLLCDLASDGAKVCRIYIKILDRILKFIYAEHDLIHDVVNDRNVQESSEHRTRRL
jgi:DNA polymerase elongation subunit (family B)